MKMKSIMPHLKTNGGLFRFLSLDSYGDLSALELGILYLTHSGNKIPGGLCRTFINDTTGIIDSEGEQQIASMIEGIYKDKWDRIWDAITMEYNPIENYNMVEDGNDGTGAQTSTTNIGARTATSENETSAFNSQNYEDATKLTNTTNAAQDSITTGARTDTHHLTRSGNIGVTTSAQLLSGEIQVRQYNFYMSMLKDIDKMLCLNIYCDDDTDEYEATRELRKLVIRQTSDGVEISDGVNTATVHNGTDGQNGQDGKTPILSLEENGDLYVDYE